MDEPSERQSLPLDYQPTPPEPPPAPVSLRRRLAACVLVLTALAAVGYALSSDNGSVAMNFVTAAFGLLLAAVFARFGNIRF